MKILHISSGLGVGGAERSLLRLVRGLSGAHEFVVVSLSGHNALATEFPCPVWNFDLNAGLLPAGAALRRCVQGFEPDLVQGWMYHGNLAASIVARGVPVIWSIRHSLERWQDEPRRLRLIIRALAHWPVAPQRVVYNSASGWRTHVGRGFGGKPSMIIPNGVDTESYRPVNAQSRRAARELYALSQAATVLGCVARFHPMKDLPTLCAALGQMPHPPDCLVLAGEGMTPDNAELRALLQQHGLLERSRCLGRVADMPALYAALDGLVLASRYGEGTPNVLLEALAVGVPAVATRVGDSAQVLDDDACLVAPGDAPALAAALSALFAQPVEARAARIDRQQQRVVERFSLTACHRQYDSLYAELGGLR